MKKNLRRRHLMVNQFLNLNFNDVNIQVRPNKDHEWILETSIVANGYSITESSLRSIKSRNESELIENKHWMVLQIATPSNGLQNKIFWTKKGVVRLGFFIKSQRAKKFRDWAEDLIISKANTQRDLSKLEILEMALQSEKEKIHLQETIAHLAPKAEYTDKVLTSRTSWTSTTIAKSLGLRSAQELHKKLNILGIIFKDTDGIWVPYSKYADKQLTETRTSTYTDSHGKLCTSITTVWTERGRNFIHERLNQKLLLA